MKETGAVPSSGSLLTSGFVPACSRKLDAPIIDIIVYEQEQKPLLYLALLDKSMLCVLDSSLNKLDSLNDLFEGVNLLFISYMFGHLAAVASHDGRIFVLDFFGRKVLCEFKAHAYRVLAFHVKGSRIVSAGRDKLRKAHVVVLEFYRRPTGPVLEVKASIKMPYVPKAVKLVTFREKRSVLVFFQASISSVLGCSTAPRYAHFYDIDFQNLPVSSDLFDSADSMKGYYPVDVSLSHNGQCYAVVSHKKGDLQVAIGDIEKQRARDTAIGNSAEWASGVLVSWSSLKDRVYLTGRDGYVRTINVANAVEMENFPIVMDFTQHIGGVKFVKAFDHDDHEVVVTVGNDDVVNVWTRPITYPILQPRVQRRR